MATRKSITALTDAEVVAIQNAFVALKREVNISDGRSTYDRYVLMHQQAMDNRTLGAEDNHATDRRNSAHRGPAFLPWHREYLARLERDLQRVAGDVNLGLPYWDWTVDATDVNNAQVNGDPLPTLSVERLAGPPGTPFNVNGQIRYIVEQGPFGFDVTNAQNPDNWWVVNERGHFVFPLERQFARDWQPQLGPQPTLPTSTDVSNAIAVAAYDSAPWNESSAASFRNILEGWDGQGLHNIVHNWVGGSMLPGTSPNDPIFFLHHCNVDRIWADWQVGKSLSDYQPQVGGPCGHSLNDAMYPWDGQQTIDVVTAANVWDYQSDMGFDYDALPS